MKSKKKAAVLMVDDSPAKLKSLEASLCDMKVDLVTCDSGRDALRILLRREFAAVLMDVKMPGLDGFETAKLIREREKTRYLPIIFVTAMSREEADARRGYGLGAVDYLVTPVVPEILRAKVQVFADLFILRRRIQEQAEELEASNRLLERQKTDIVALNMELEAFSYSVSHDLRAPLRAVDGFSLALLQGYADKLDDQGRHYLDRVRAGARHMGELIDDLLKLSRIVRSDMRRETVDLSAMALRLVEEIRKAEPERVAEFTIAGGIVVEGDGRLLRVAVQNLLGNAWKFTGKTAGKARIEFGAARNAECAAPNEALGADALVCYVRDNGAGFDMAFADKLFGAFQRLHRADEFEGTGIGLATVQRIILRHGGRVWARGAVGEGATFFFTLAAG